MIDDGLPRDARDLLAAGRDRLGPDAATVVRLRARVEAAVIVAAATGASAMAAPAATAAPAAAAAPAAVATTTTVTTATTVAAKSLALKLVVVAVGASAVGTGAYVAREAVTDESATRAVLPPPPAVPTTGDDNVVDVLPRVAVSAPETTRVDPAPTVAAPVEHTSSEHAVPAAPPTEPASAPQHATLTREIELVDRATIALRAGDLDAALAALRAYGAETSGGGQLAQDAAALHIEVLCRTHAPGARAELAAFDTRWPHSAQRPHLATICTESSQ